MAAAVCLSEPDAYGFPCIFNDAGGFAVAVAVGCIGCDVDDAERAPFYHAGITALATADGQGAAGVVVGEFRGAVGAAFVAVGGAVIFVESE